MNLPPVTDYVKIQPIMFTQNLGVIIPKPDHGVRMPSTPVQRARSLYKAIKPDEAVTRWGAKAIKMNFVPQMLTALALDQASNIVEHCRRHRYKKLLKHTRVITACIERYAEKMYRWYGKSGRYRTYVNYVDRYNDYVAVDIQKMWFSIGNVTNKQIPREKDRDLATQIAITHHLIDYIEEYDKKIDRFLYEEIHEPIGRKQDECLLMIATMCLAIEEDFGLRVEREDMIELNLGVLANKAALLADIILEEEGVKV